MPYLGQVVPARAAPALLGCKVGPAVAAAEGQTEGAAGEKSTRAGAAGATEPDALNDIAALLAEQLSACHAAAARCFAIANDEEDFQLPVRLDALKLGARLVQASAQAASAVKRIKGGQFHHHVTVHRIDYAAEKAARKAREQAAKTVPGEAKRKLMEKLQRMIDAKNEMLTDEERATIENIEREAEKRRYSPRLEKIIAEQRSGGGTA